MAYKNTPLNEMSAFGNRLMALMKSKKGCDTPRKLATQLYEAGYLQVHHREVNNLDIKGVDRKKYAIDSIEKKIQKHFHLGTTISQIQSEFILAYSKFFNCSADYLLGLTPIKSSDMEVRGICEKLCISETAVNRLLYMTGSNRNSLLWGCRAEQYQRIISSLFSAEGFVSFVTQLGELDDTYLSLKNIWNELEKNYDKQFLDDILKVYNDGTIDYLNYPEDCQLTEEQIHALQMVNQVIDRSRNLEESKRIRRFEVWETILALVEELYPRKKTS